MPTLLELVGGSFRSAQAFGVDTTVAVAVVVPGPYGQEAGKASWQITVDPRGNLGSTKKSGVMQSDSDEHAPSSSILPRKPRVRVRHEKNPRSIAGRVASL
jgi:hypothetical protein